MVTRRMSEQELNKRGRVSWVPPRTDNGVIEVKGSLQASARSEAPPSGFRSDKKDCIETEGPRAGTLGVGADLIREIKQWF